MLLLDIMDIVFSPKITPGMINQLALLIEEHHTLFLKEFETHLIPKDHLLVHYPFILEIMGPVVYLWGMRFEGKHKYFSDLIKKFVNFKNLPMTLANQHQLYIFEKWNNENKVFDLKVGETTGKKCNLKTLIENYELKHIDHSLKCTDEVLATDSIDYGIDFRKNSFIFVGFNEKTDLPEFYKIHQPFIHKEMPYAICKK